MTPDVLTLGFFFFWVSTASQIASTTLPEFFRRITVAPLCAFGHAISVQVFVACLPETIMATCGTRSSVNTLVRWPMVRWPMVPLQDNMCRVLAENVLAENSVIHLLWRQGGVALDHQLCLGTLI